MDTHGLALDNVHTSCGLPLSAEQRQLLAGGVKLMRLAPPTCRACLAAEHRDGLTVPWYFKAAQPGAILPR
jgi:hypothetical protein